MIPPGAPVFCSASQAVRRRYEIRGIRESELPTGHPVAFRVTLQPDGIAAHAEAAAVRADTFTPLDLTPSRQPDQTASAVRKAFERLGDTAWRFGSLALDDPHALYAPLSKLNEARRAVLERLTEAHAAARAQHRAAIVFDGENTREVGLAVPCPPQSHALTCGGQRTGRPTLIEPCPSAAEDASPPKCPVPLWSLKLRIDTPLLAASALDGIDTLVLAIAHTPPDTIHARLADWRALTDPSRITLALPLLTRAPELPALKAAIRQLADAGWTRWECADLAGHRILAEHDITPHSADWSLYAMNRAALAELTRLGIRNAVLSPENSLDNIRALCAASGLPEVIAYQHSPLFISETAPGLPSLAAPIRLTDRRRRTFTVQRLDSRWITISDTPFCIADRIEETGATRFRIDLSWSPPSACTAATIVTVRAGHLPPHSHAANLDRGFL